MRSAQHDLAIYRSSSEYVEHVLAFVAPVIWTGGSAVLLLARTNRVAVSRAIEKAGLSSERIQLLDGDYLLSAFLRTYQTNLEAFYKTIGYYARSAEQHGNGQVAIVGEIAPLLWAQGEEEACTALEGLWTRFLRSHPHRLLCMYAEAILAAPDAAEAVCTMHHLATAPAPS